MRLALLMSLMIAGTALGQLSPEEAERRLQERQAMRQSAATQPADRALVDKLMTQIASMEREIAGLKAENERLRNGIAFDETAKVVPSAPRVRLSGLSGAGGAIDRIPSRLMSKKAADETFLDLELRNKWISDNYAGCGLSISKATLGNVSLAGDGFGVSAHGTELGSPPCNFTLKAEIPMEFKGRMVGLNDGDEISIVGTIKSISLNRAEIRLPNYDKSVSGFSATVELVNARIISVVRKPKRN
jgi:hypothetical protein